MSTGKTPEARARHAEGSRRGHLAALKANKTAGNTSEKGRKGRAKSPWSRSPMCEGQNAMAKWKCNRENANG